MAAQDHAEAFSAALLERLHTVNIRKIPGDPGVLFDRQHIEQCARRFRDLAAPAEELRAKAARLMDDPGLDERLAHNPPTCHGELSTLAEAALVSEDAAMIERVNHLLDRVFSAATWVHLSHRAMGAYDHSTGNVAAAIAEAVNLVGWLLPAGRVAEIQQRLISRIAEPFAHAYESRSEFWATRDYRQNWKIMTCGASGLAVLFGYDDSEPARRALRAALDGVLDVLDALPEQGDYLEGVAYWSGTLGKGLRFALALRRATNGAIDVFQHPRLQPTADFLLSHIQPDNTVFDWSDSGINYQADIMTLIAAGLQRRDLLYMVRKCPVQDIWQILYDDPAIAAQPPALESACFQQNGVAALRNGWTEDATFAGFKCGPAAAGHAHLHQNSFIITRGRAHLAVDSGSWPYAHMMGFFDFPQPGHEKQLFGRKDQIVRRFNFDGLGSFGHSTILVDGLGQEFSDPAGHVEAFHTSAALDYVVGQAGACYGGRLRSFRRWFIWAKPDFFLVVDRLLADRHRHFEWIIQYRAEIADAPADPKRLPPTKPGLAGSADTPYSPPLRTVIRDGAEQLTVDMIYPSYHYGVRIGDVTRRTFYRSPDSGVPVEPFVRYRSYSPLHFAPHMTFVVGMYLGRPEDIAMRLVSDEGILPGGDDNPFRPYYWPEHPIPAPAVEFTIAGQKKQTITLDEDNLRVCLQKQ